MAEQAGTRLGHYRLVEPIGTGGFATVYRAVDERLDSEVAVKVLAENHALDVEIRERFLGEARALRRVACEAVVPVYDIGETERAQPYIVLAYADRGDLRDRITKRGAAGHQSSAEDLVTVAETLAVALGRAHRVGLIHRDVKPTNLLISSTKGEARGRPLGRTSLLAHDERLLLGDLGLAKDLAASSGLTVGAGTHGFNAPEQRAGLGQVDPRTDVYGASAVLYWMATTALPPDDDDERAHRLATVRLPHGLGRAIGVGLATEPADRFESIEEWWHALTVDDPTQQPALDQDVDRAGGVTDGGDGHQAVPTSSRSQPLPAVDTRADPGDRADREQSADERRRPRTGRRAQTGGRRRLGTIVAAAAIGAAAATAVTYALVREPEPAVTELGDGTVQVVARRDGLTVAVTGPRTVGVDEPLELEASADGATAFRWFTPDGSVVSGNPLVLRSSGPGPAQVTLVASDAGGRTATVEFGFEVVE